MIPIDPDDEVTPTGGPGEVPDSFVKPTPKITPAPPAASPRPSTILSKADELERELALKNEPEWAKKTNPKIKLERLDEEYKKKQRWRIPKIVSSAIGVLLGGGGIGTSLHHASKAQDAAEESAQVIRSARLDQRLTDEQAAREKLESKVGEIDRRTITDSVKLNLLLDANHVPESKRPKEQP